jgi:hypothetical protein
MYGTLGTAVAVAALSLWLIRVLGIRGRDGQPLRVPPKETTPGLRRYWMGGTVFGFGWALLGACPGPIFSLIGSGVTVMVVALVAALLGTWAYAWLRPVLPHIDPQRDIDRYVEIARAEGLEITAVAETHIHADFLSGCREFAVRFGVKVFLPGDAPEEWRYRWTGGLDVTFLRDGDSFPVGNIEVRALHTPGHTPEHVSFMVTDRGGGASEPMGVARPAGNRRRSTGRHGTVRPSTVPLRHWIPRSARLAAGLARPWRRQCLRQSAGRCTRNHSRL